MIDWSDAHPALEAELVRIGVVWPWHGYAPGSCCLPCRRCARRHTAAKGSYRCLPCALRDALDTGEKAREAAYHVDLGASSTMEEEDAA